MCSLRRAPVYHRSQAFRTDYSGIHLRRDKLSSIAYPEKLNSYTISTTFQGTDRRYGIVGQKSSDFQLDS